MNVYLIILVVLLIIVMFLYIIRYVSLSTFSLGFNSTGAFIEPTDNQSSPGGSTLIDEEKARIINQIDVRNLNSIKNSDMPYLKMNAMQGYEIARRVEDWRNSDYNENKQRYDNTVKWVADDVQRAKFV